jgi:branched-chain amino acid transport system permease protein
MNGIDRSRALFVAACFGALALLPLLSGSYGVDLVTKIMVYAIFALSLELLVGATGLVCFGQAAFFGIGA